MTRRTAHSVFVTAVVVLGLASPASGQPFTEAPLIVPLARDGGSVGDEADALTPFDQSLYYTSWFDRTEQLVRYDAVTDRTRQLTRLPEGYWIDGPLAVLGGRLFYTVEHWSGAQLIGYDPATGEHTRFPSATAGLASVDGLVTAGTRLAYIGATPTGLALFSFDPVTGARDMAPDVEPLGVGEVGLAVEGDRVFALARVTSNVSYSLLAYDVEQGTAQMLTPPGNGDDVTQMTVLGVIDSDVYVAAANRHLGLEPWRYRSDDRSFRPLADVNEGDGWSNPGRVAEGPDGRVYFAATDERVGQELHVFDPTTQRVSMAANIGRDGADPSTDALVATPVAWNGRLYFAATQKPPPIPSGDSELWVYDPELRAASLVWDLLPGSSLADGSRPRDLVEFDGHLVFTARDAEFVRTPYRYVQQQIELAAASFETSEVSSPGSLTLTIFLRNHSDAEVSGRLQVRVVGPDGTTNVRWAGAATQLVPSSAARVEVPVFLPDGALPGSYDGTVALVDGTGTDLAAAPFRFTVTG